MHVIAKPTVSHKSRTQRRVCVWLLLQTLRSRASQMSTQRPILLIWFWLWLGFARWWLKEGSGWVRYKGGGWIRDKGIGEGMRDKGKGRYIEEQVDRQTDGQMGMRTST